MSAWVQKDRYHMKNGEWTISKTLNVPKPYGLWQGDVNKGHFISSDEAKAKHLELTHEKN